MVIATNPWCSELTILLNRDSARAGPYRLPERYESSPGTRARSSHVLAMRVRIEHGVGAARCPSAVVDIHRGGHSWVPRCARSLRGGGPTYQPPLPGVATRAPEDREGRASCGMAPCCPLNCSGTIIDGRRARRVAGRTQDGQLCDGTRAAPCAARQPVMVGRRTGSGEGGCAGDGGRACASAGSGGSRGHRRQARADPGRECHRQGYCQRQHYLGSDWCASDAQR